jgi:hypothetical protein
VIRWRPILIATDVVVGVLGTALLGAMLDWNNILFAFFFIAWLMAPLAVARRREDLRIHFIAASGFVLWMLKDGAVPVLFVTGFLLSVWLIVAAVVARVTT